MIGVCSRLKGGQQHRVAYCVLGKLRFNTAALLQHRIEQWNEFGGKSELAICGMPAGGEDKQRALSNRDLKQGGIAIIKSRQYSRVGDLFQIEAAMFPEVDLGEVAEARSGKWGKKWMLKIDLPEHGVIASRGFANRQILDSGKVRNGLCSGIGVLQH